VKHLWAWCPECRKVHFTWPGAIVLGVSVWTVIFLVARLWGMWFG